MATEESPSFFDSVARSLTESGANSASLWIMNSSFALLILSLSVVCFVWGWNTHVLFLLILTLLLLLLINWWVGSRTSWSTLKAWCVCRVPVCLLMPEMYSCYTHASIVTACMDPAWCCAVARACLATNWLLCRLGWEFDSAYRYWY